MPLYEEWWFWALSGSFAAIGVAREPAYRRWAARLRAAAAARGLTGPGPGREIDPTPGGPGSELSWLAFLAGAWIVLGPWIWGYADVDGAVACDVATGALVLVVAAAGILFPALLSLNLLAGTWLMTAPWLVGYGTDGGPVGLSDVTAGLLVCALALHGLVMGARRARPAQAQAIGRLPRRH